LIPTPEGVERLITRQSLAISPAGDRIAMLMRDQRGPMVWVQRLSSFAPIPLEGTEGATSVFWSPDAQFVGFWAGGKLKKIPAGGGTPVPICDLAEPWSATWNDRGVILTSAARLGSWIINLDSGAVKAWKPVSWARFLPGGK